MSLKTWALAGIAARVLALRRGVREEVRHAATAFALALAGAVCGLAALGFVATAIMLAAGEAHRVLAASLLAVLFAVLALWALAGMRAQASGPPRG